MYNWFCFRITISYYSLSSAKCNNIIFCLLLELNKGEIGIIQILISVQSMSDKVTSSLTFIIIKMSDNISLLWVSVLRIYLSCQPFHKTVKELSHFHKKKTWICINVIVLKNYLFIFLKKVFVCLKTV